MVINTWEEDADYVLSLKYDLAEKDKQIAEWQSDNVNLRGAMKAKDKQIAQDKAIIKLLSDEMKAKDKLIAELEKALAICESEYRKADKQIAELVDVLEKMLYTNCTMYREQADALVDRYRKGD